MGFIRGRRNVCPFFVVLFIMMKIFKINFTIQKVQLICIFNNTSTIVIS
jgi:hypothetical protein